MKNKRQAFLFLVGLQVFMTTAVFCQTTESMVFTTSGTFTVPMGVSSITIEVIGGGGAGSKNGGGGGGGGGYAKGTYSVTPNTNLAVTIGAGGVRDPDPIDGGTTSVGTLISATGGKTGVTSGYGGGGAGGVGMGTINRTGGNGGSGLFTYFGGGGGGAAGSTSDGTNGANTASSGCPIGVAAGGTGGGSPAGDGGTGGGFLSAGCNTPQSPTNGQNYGGGGGAGHGTNASEFGRGADGYCKITWVSPIQIFTTSGTYTVPTGVTAIEIEVIGGGGGGGFNGGGGGGGGGYAKGTYNVTPGANLAVIIGVGGVSGASFRDGGTTSVATYISATGGKTGIAVSYGGGGAGGVGIGGTINRTGGTGGSGSYTNLGGGGGGAAGTTSNGGNGADVATSGCPIGNPVGGTGGGSPAGNGGNGGGYATTGCNTPNAGGNGQNYGGGGGGANGSLSEGYGLGANGYAKITATTNSVIAIELLSLTGQLTEQHVDLSWSTAQERGNAYFIVEKSLDSKTWTPIGKVKGAGHAQTQHDYTFQDPTLSANVLYYRLKTIGFDGQMMLSPTVSVSLQDHKGDLIVFPNPVKDRIQVLNATGNEIFTLFNTNGQVMWSGKAIGQVDCSLLSRGLYILKIENEKGFKTVKVMMNGE
jgi:hypothetical protein